MKDKNADVLYVGKAKNLKNRVKNYFSKSSDNRYQIQFLMSRVADIAYIVTDTEKEALILENTLIKQHRPRYNINLRDDKTYFSLRMDMREEFPRLTIIRRVVRDGARYFGPYSSAAAARETLKQLYRIFPLRHYPLETCRRRKRPCLFHQIGQCSAPCHGLISAERYRDMAQGAALFLEGRSRVAIIDLRVKMTTAAEAERYEEAARYRDLIRAIEMTVEKQKVVAAEGDMDIVGIHSSGPRMDLSMLFIRGGNLIGSRNFDFSWELDVSEAISSFIVEYYGNDVYIPKEVVIPVSIDDADPLGDLLSEKAGHKVKVFTPSRGGKRDLVAMAAKNAETAALKRKKDEEDASAVLEELKEKLHLTRLPRRIECYDISNIQGRFPCGSRVSFFDGRADKTKYRHYRIRTVEGSNDFAMMKETLSRRFRSQSADEFPDLIIVDGGLGQLGILSTVLDDLAITEIDLAALAKSRVERSARETEIRKSEERVFLPGRKNPVVLRQNSPALLLLARIRDEAHRFAVTYHQKLRGKANLRSALEEIPGIGAKRKTSLLRHFGSMKRLKEASMEELQEAPGMTAASAHAVHAFFHAPPPALPENAERGDSSPLS